MSDNEELQEVSDAEIESMISNDNSSQPDSLGNVDNDEDVDLSSLGSDEELNIPSELSNTKNTSQSKISSKSVVNPTFNTIRSFISQSISFLNIFRF